jgi:hypothetical protein
VWTRFYIYLDQQPNAGAGFLRAVAFYTGATQNAGAVVTGLGLGGGGQWQYLNSAGGSAVTGIFNNTGGGALNQWQRIEAQYDLGAAGTVIFRDFIAANVHGTTPSRTFTSGATAMSGAPGQIRFGHTTGELNIRGWLAMVAVSDEGWIGPWTPPPPPPAGPRAWDGAAWRTEGRAWDGAAWRTPGRAWDGTAWRG